MTTRVKYATLVIEIESVQRTRKDESSYCNGETFSFVDNIVVDRVGVDSDENYERVLDFDVNYRYDAATDDFRGNFSRWNSSERTHEEYYI